MTFFLISSPFLSLLQLCYLYSDLYKQTNSKETRRVFLEFHQFFLDRSAVSYQVNILQSLLQYLESLSSAKSQMPCCENTKEFPVEMNQLTSY